MHKYILPALLLTLALTSCGEEFLDRGPIDQIEVADFFQTPAEFEAATLAIYATLQSQGYYGQAFELDDVPSDDSSKSFDQGIDNFAANANNQNIADYWEAHYQAITRANIVIEKAAESDLADEDLTQFVAEARFLRGITYFDLVRLFGGVPIVTEIPTLDRDLLPARASVDEVYQFLIADLEAAMEVLPSQHNPARATRDAAAAYLASVHLTLASRGNELGSFARAAELARSVINSGNYRLLDDYGDLWRYPESDNTLESIFEIQFTGCGPWGTGNQRQAFYAPFNQGITGNTDGWGVMVPSAPGTDASPGTTAVDIWEEGDERRYWTLFEPENKYDFENFQEGYTYPEDGVGGRRANIKKFVIGGGADVCFMSTPQNASIMRLSEVGLILAEALARQAGGATVAPQALGIFNGLRTRAGLDPLLLVELDDIELERRREFMFEGKRWFDILRKGDAAAVSLMRLHGRTLTAEKLLFPLPALELEVNPNLVQNPGY